MLPCHCVMRGTVVRKLRNNSILMQNTRHTNRMKAGAERDGRHSSQAPRAWRRPEVQTIARQGERAASLVVWLLSIGFLLFFCLLSWLRYLALHTTVDLALYSQVVWNTLHGDFFRNSVLLFTEHYLGNHFSPILGAFLPLYALWADPRGLLITQACANVLAAWPLYWLARKRLWTPWAGVLFVAAFFLYPALHHQLLDDLHGIALATPVVMLAFFALLDRRDRLLFTAIPLMVLIREDVPLLIIMMGVYAFLVQRRRRLGTLLFVLGLAISALVILVVIPFFRGSGGYRYNEYYAYLGESPIAIVQTFLLEPGAVLARLLHPPKLELLFQLLAPVAFLPLLALPVALLGASALAYMLLVDFPFLQVYSLNSQYQALFIPVIFAGAVEGLAWIARRGRGSWDPRRTALVGSGIVLATSLLSLWFWGPLANEAKRAEFRIDEQSRAEWGLISQIPPAAGVVAEERLGAPLSTRADFYIFGGLFARRADLEYLLFSDTPVGYHSHPPAVVDPLPGGGWVLPRYEEIGSAGTTRLWRRAGLAEVPLVAEPVDFGNAVALLGATGANEPLQATPGRPLEIGLVWEALAPDLPRLVFFVHLVETRSGIVHRWSSADRELYGGLFPTDRWDLGVPMGDLISLEIPPWLPPGTYELHAGVYTREDGMRLARANGETTAKIGVVEVAVPEPLADRKAVQPPIGTDLNVAEGLKLHGHTPFPERTVRGEMLDFTLFWRATEPMRQSYQARFDLIGSTATAPAATWTLPLVGGRFPNTTWQPGTIVADWVTLPLPTNLEPGEYRLYVSAAGSDDPDDKPVQLTTITVTE